MFVSVCLRLWGTDSSRCPKPTDLCMKLYYSLVQLVMRAINFSGTV